VAVSPDGNTALVNHRLGARNTWDNDLWQVSRGQRPRQVTARGNGWAYFSKDGSVFQYNAEDGLTHIARTADDAVLPGVTAPSLFWYPGAEPGQWLVNYAIRNGHWEAERIHLPDFERQVLEVGASPAPNSPDVIAALSPNGESYLTCARFSYAPDFVPQWTACDVILAGAPTPLHFPLIEAWQFSPDGTSIVVDCDLYRAEGLVGRVCDSSTAAAGSATIFSADSSTVVAYAPSQIEVTPATGGDSVFLDRPCIIPNGYISIGQVSADGGRLIATCDRTLFEASTAGGAWTAVATDSLRSDAADDRSWSFSPDSRVLQVPSGGQGIVLSVDGAPPRQVLMNGRPLFTNSVVFEPQGGHQRAIFFTDERTFVIGNQDGSGDWVSVPGFNLTYPEWSGHSVLSWAMSPGADYSRLRYDISVITATGTLQPLVSNVASALPNRPSLINPTLWFIPDAGGLYAIPIPQP
jgi:hypothetical protein